MNFLPKKILAVDISDSSIEILQVSQFLGKIKASFLSRSEIAKGVIEKGKIVNRKQLVLKLKEYASGASTNKIALAIPDAIIATHILRFPKDKYIKKEDVLSEAMKVISVDLGKIYWDFDVMDVDDAKIAFFVSALKSDIDEYKLLFEELDMVPELFDLNSLCALRAINIDYDDVLIVDIGGRYGVLSAFSGGSLQSVNLVNFGGENFTEKLSEKLNATYEQAEIFKMNVGFDADKEDGRVFLALEDVMQPLIDEVRKVINDYEEKNNKKIKKIILSGGSSLIPKLGEYIYENLSIEAEMGRPRAGNMILDYLKSNNVAGGIDTIFFATTLGLALKYFGERSDFDMGINLLK